MHIVQYIPTPLFGFIAYVGSMCHTIVIGVRLGVVAMLLLVCIVDGRRMIRRRPQPMGVVVAVRWRQRKRILAETQIFVATQNNLQSRAYEHTNDIKYKMISNTTLQKHTGGVLAMSMTRFSSRTDRIKSLLKTAPTMTIFRLDFTMGMTLAW